MKKLFAVAALSLGATSCLGPNHMFNGLTNWNANVTEQDWVAEVIYLGLNIIPVYWFALAADGLVVNTIDYWSGNNPVSDPGAWPDNFSNKD